MKEQPKKPIGLGDVVKTFTSPVTRTVDKLFGSNWTECVPCNTTRKARLNKLMPDITKPFS